MDDDDTKPGMMKPDRYVYGSRPVGALIPALTKPAFKKTSAAAAQVMMDWPSIVGPQLAAITAPRRLSGGTLTIDCVGPVAMELQHMAIEIMSRINGHLGTQAVRALRFMQVARKPFIEEAPPPPPRNRPLAEAAVGDMPPGPLRDALVSLGSALLAPQRPSTNRVTKR